jgi:predicted transcriptional regulator
MPDGIDPAEAAMARQKTPTLTAAELRLMDIIWEQGETTVSDVRDALSKRDRLAYNTILTTLRILESKGYLSHTKEGRAHLFRPLVSRRQARLQALRHVVGNFFGNSHALLLRSMLEDESLSAEDVEELKQMIRDSEKE